jgi:universal stress protein A
MTAVLVGVDGSDGSRRAAEFARGVAASFGARLTVLHVVEPLPASVVMGSGVPLEQLREQMLREGQRILEEMCNDLGLSQAEQIIEHGRAPEAICAEAQERKVDMIVVGAHGHGPRRLLPGSVGSRLVSIADRTVTIVR